MNEKGNYNTALNFILTAYCLNDTDKMKDGFQQLLDIPLLIDDETKYVVCWFFFSLFFDYFTNYATSSKK